MKKSLFIFGLLAVASAFNACKKKENTTSNGNNSGGLVVEQKQKSLLVYATATWCGPCGSSGSPIFKAAAESSEIIGLNFQSSGSSDLVPHYKRPGNDTPYISPFIIQLNASNRPNGYIPHFTLNNVSVGNSSTPSSTLISSAQTFNAKSPEVGVAAKASLSGNKFTIEAKTKWFTAGSGEYFTTAFIVEKLINQRQAVGSAYQASFEHKKVIRASTGSVDATRAAQTVFAPTASGSVATGTEKNLNLSFTWSDVAKIGTLNQWVLGNASNYTVVVVVYKKNGDLYDFVNGTEVNVN